MTGPAIRPASPSDEAAIWTILEPVIRAGETYPLPRGLSRDEAFAYWFAPGHACFVAESDGQIAGIYHLRANNRGGGSHVANCGFMTRPDARGRGIASAMCVHALEEARRRGFSAMQFNFVIASNEAAVRLWTKMGFAIVGTLPGAFEHPRLGRVDAYVMWRDL